MYIIKMKSIIYMDPARHKDKPLRMCEEATHRQGDRDKLISHEIGLSVPTSEHFQPPARESRPV
jgi:hypothetical protein